MRRLKTASLACGLVLSFALAVKSQTDRFPPLATSDSPWNVVADGGKGEMHGAPICRPLSFFASSPKALDFDADFFNLKASDLSTRANVTLVGTISGRKIYNLELTVHDRSDSNAFQSTQPTLGVVLVQRGPEEYCDIFQNQYAYNLAGETNEIDIIHVDGQELLEVYQTDNHTYFIEYWAMNDQGPARLDLDGFYRTILSGLPDAPDIRWLPPLDLTDYPQLELHTAAGTLDVYVRVQGTKLVIAKKVWTPN